MQQEITGQVFPHPLSSSHGYAVVSVWSLIKVYWCSLALVIYFIPLAVQRWEMQIDKLLVKGAKTAKVHSKQKNIIWLGLRRRPVRWVFINSLIYSFKELRRIDINNAYTENNHEIKIEGFQKARFKTVK